MQDAQMTIDEAIEKPPQGVCEPISDAVVPEKDTQAVEEIITAQTAFEGDLEVSQKALDDFNRSIDEKRETERKKERHMQHVRAAQVGQIIAFYDDNGKAKSAKIVKKSMANERFKVETKYGAEFIVPFENVIWVRTGHRWARSIYKILKGETNVAENATLAES